MRHGPVDAIRLADPESNGNGEAPAKGCPECHALTAAGYANCPECGHEFPPRQRTRHDATAGSEAILSDQVARTEYEVTDVFYAVHVKRNGPPEAPRTMRVDYPHSPDTIGYEPDELVSQRAA